MIRFKIQNGAIWDIIKTNAPYKEKKTKSVALLASYFKPTFITVNINFKSVLKIS